MTCMDPSKASDRANIPICLNVGGSETNGNGTVDIYAKSGQKIRNLYAGVFSGGLNRMTWDGKNDDGELIGSGIYIAIFNQDGHAKARTKVLRVR